jgi:hypothetical protein
MSEGEMRREQGQEGEPKEAVELVRLEAIDRVPATAEACAISRG